MLIREKSKQDGPRKNEEISCRKPVRVIGPDGDQLGIMLVQQAIDKAKEIQLDLVEVSPNADPIVCKIMNYGKQAYLTQKKQTKTKSKSQKELRIKPRIGQHDLDIKIKSARRFIEDGMRVQLTMVYRGREMAHRELGEDVLKKVVDELEDVAKIEKQPFREGRNVKVIISPKKSI